MLIKKSCAFKFMESEMMKIVTKNKLVQGSCYLFLFLASTGSLLSNCPTGLASLIPTCDLHWIDLLFHPQDGPRDSAVPLSFISFSCLASQWFNRLSRFRLWVISSTSSSPSAAESSLISVALFLNLLVSLCPSPLLFCFLSGCPPVCAAISLLWFVFSPSLLL